MDGTDGRSQMMSGDLVVDFGLLENTDHALGVLATEFKDASAIVSDYSADVGAPVLIGALEAFATDWNAHRAQLLSSIQSVRQLAAEGEKQFRATDGKLASDLRRDGGA
jgi:hypothetical protein